MQKGKWSQRIRRIEKGKPGAEEGSALIFVICIMMVAVILSMSLLLALGRLLTIERQIPAKEQCRIMTDSISRLLNKELTKDEYQGIPEGRPEGEGLWDYAGAYIWGGGAAWPDYEEGRPGHDMDQARREFGFRGQQRMEGGGRRDYHRPLLGESDKRGVGSGDEPGGAFL